MEGYEWPVIEGAYNALSTGRLEQQFDADHLQKKYTYIYALFEIVPKIRMYCTILHTHICTEYTYSCVQILVQKRAKVENEC